jgi:hypothetical protein
MLSRIENYFVSLLRGTVIATAFLSFLVTVLALLFAAYAHLAPEPQAETSKQIERFRSAVDPGKLIAEVFPTDSSVAKEGKSTPDGVAFDKSRHYDEETFGQFNKFLDVALGASFDSQAQFSDWLHGPNHIVFGWNLAIDHKDANDNDNVQNLVRSLLSITRRG